MIIYFYATTLRRKLQQENTVQDKDTKFSKRINLFVLLPGHKHACMWMIKIVKYFQTDTDVSKANK